VADVGYDRLGVGCVRVSTDRQERSIDEQKECIRAAAQRDGVGLLDNGMWCEDEGISGSILDRPGMRKLLNLCRTRQDITDVYFWKRNRLARSIDPLDGMNIEREIEKCGKRVHFVQGIQKTGNKMLDFIASGLEYAEAGQYLVNLSADTSRGLIPLTRQGFDAGRPTPYGYDRQVVARNGDALYTVRDLGGGACQQIFPDGQVQTYAEGVRPVKDSTAHSTLVLGLPERVEVVRRIFESYARKEKGIRTLVEELNSDGIPSPRGGKWSVGTVRSILVNPLYHGANIWNVRNFSQYHRIAGGTVQEIDEAEAIGLRRNKENDWIVADDEHGFDALISKELFDLAQTKRGEKKLPFRRGKAVVSPYYLSGLAVCTCGHKLHGLTKTSGKKKGYRKYSYYICGGYQMKGRTVCPHRLMAREHLEKPVLDALGRRLREMADADRLRAKIAEELLAGMESNGGDAESLPSKIADVETRIKRWEEAIEKGVNVDMAVGKLNELVEEKKRLEAKLRAIKAARQPVADVQALAESILKGLDELEQVLAQGSVVEVRALLRTYIGRIEVDPKNGKARIGFIRLPIRALLSAPAQESVRIKMVAGARYMLYTRLRNFKAPRYVTSTPAYVAA